MISKRFLITFVLLALGMVGLAWGVNAVLASESKAPTQNTLVIYDAQGQALYAYSGDINSFALYPRPVANFTGPRFLHRT